jgi:hypothetical protein
MTPSGQPQEGCIRLGCRCLNAIARSSVMERSLLLNPNRSPASDVVNVTMPKMKCLTKICFGRFQRPARTRASWLTASRCFSFRISAKLREISSSIR